MALDGPRVALTPDELARRFPTTYRPLGRFKDNPNYFRRKGRTLETPKGRVLAKQLKRRNLPKSWVPLLMKLNLKPGTLRQRLKDLESLNEEIETINRTTREVRSQIQTLLGKNSKNDSISNATINPEHPSTDHPEVPYDSSTPSLSGMFGPQRKIQGQSESCNLSTLLFPPLSPGSHQSPGDGREQEDPPDEGLLHERQNGAELFPDSEEGHGSR
jgi:hypothetical protein